MCKSSIHKIVFAWNCFLFLFSLFLCGEMYYFVIFVRVQFKRNEKLKTEKNKSNKRTKKKSRNDTKNSKQAIQYIYTLEYLTHILIYAKVKLAKR